MLLLQVLPKRLNVQVLILGLTLLGLSTIPTTLSKTDLDPYGIYNNEEHARECLSIVWNVANTHLRVQTIANCLRFAFHDAGTYDKETDKGGANGSIMQELDFAVFFRNAGLSPCAELLPTIIDEVRASGCPEITTADAIQVVGAAGVAILGGPTCDMLMGRPDADSADDISILPSPCSTANQQIEVFTRNGYQDPATSLVVLSGAHNIGRSTVVLPPRAANCTQGVGNMTAHPESFDGHYYTEVVDGTGRQGQFASDKSLTSENASTVDLMTQFANDPQAFLNVWCQHYRELSLLGVNLLSEFGLNSGWSPDITVTPN